MVKYGYFVCLHNLRIMKTKCAGLKKIEQIGSGLINLGTGDEFFEIGMHVFVREGT